MLKLLLGEHNMKINEIHISNFKSFNKTSFYLKDFNMILGANGSGKSNFSLVIKFLGDIAKHGLENAIAMQGGKEFLTNRLIGPNKPLELELVVNPRAGEFLKAIDEKTTLVCQVDKLKYKIVINFNDDDFDVQEDLHQDLKYVLIDTEIEGKYEEIETVGAGSSRMNLKNGAIYDQTVNVPDDVLDKYNLKEGHFTRAFNLYNQNPDEKNFNFMMLKKPILFNGGLHRLVEFLENSSIFYIDPKEAKKAVQVIGKTNLEEDGSNLPLVLSKIIKNKKDGKKLTSLINQLLPFINQIKIEKQPDNSLYFEVQETYQDETTSSFPSSLLSDGTINVTALVIALFFEKQEILFFEEPERNIHPQLLSSLLNMMKDVSSEKQIILTSHNPEIVKYLDADSLIFIKRNNRGFSKAIYPQKNELFMEFLNNGIGIEDIFVKDLIFDEDQGE